MKTLLHRHRKPRAIMTMLVFGILLLGPMVMGQLVVDLTSGDYGYSISARDIDGVCDCIGRTAAVSKNPTECSDQAQYEQLLALRTRTKGLLDFAATLSTSGVHERVEKINARIKAIEANLQSQFLAISMQNITSLQKEVTLMKSLVKMVPRTANNSATLTQMEEELSNVNDIVDEVMSQDPMENNADLLSLIGELKSRLGEMKGNLSGHVVGAFTFPGDVLPVPSQIDASVCDRKEVSQYGQPVTHQYMGAKGGSWMRDTLPTSEANKTQIFYVDGYYQYPYIRYWPNHMELIKDPTGVQINRIHPDYLYGTKMVLYKGDVYYFRSTGHVVRKSYWHDHGAEIKAVLHLGNYTQKLYRRPGDYMFVDINLDETGMYIVYTVKDHGDDMYISKIDPNKLVILKTWATGMSKANYANVYFICGVMYTQNTYTSSSPSRTQKAFDTKLGRAVHPEATIPAIYRSLFSISYNPIDRILFAWDNGHLVTLQVYFKDKTIP